MLSGERIQNFILKNTVEQCQIYDHPGLVQPSPYGNRALIVVAMSRRIRHGTKHFAIARLIPLGAVQAMQRMEADRARERRHCQGENA